MHRLLPLVALLATPSIAATPEPPAAPVRLTLAPDAEARWVDFDLTPGNQIAFAMTIDGRPATALLDTGFTRSALSRRWAGAAGLRISDGGSGLGVGGRVAIGQVGGRDLTIGGLTRNGGRLAVVDLPAFATGGGAAIDVVIGGDVLRHYALDVDFAARRFRLLPSGRLPFAGKAAPLAIRDDLYTSELRIGDTRLRPVIVDTGDGSSLTLSSDAWRGLGARPLLTSTVSYSVAGAIQSDLAILRGVAVGGLPVGETETLIEPARGFSATLGTAGRVGIGLLRRFRVLLDPDAGRMVLAPSAATDEPALRSTSGLLVGVEPGRLRVLHVMRGSPAASGGWRAGEAICSIDGAAIPRDYAARPIARWSVAAPGRITRLGLCGGATRSLTAAAFY